MDHVQCDECCESFPTSKHHSGEQCPRCGVGRLRPPESAAALRAARKPPIACLALLLAACEVGPGPGPVGDTTAGIDGTGAPTGESSDGSECGGGCVAAECWPWVCMESPDDHEVYCVKPCAAGDDCTCVVVDGIGGCFP